MTGKELIAKTSYDVRGRILQKSIELEMMVDNYLTKHFTNNEIKFTEFVCLILSRMTFENKFQAMSFLLDTYNLNFKETNPGYKKDMLDIIQVRNIFAHYPVDFSDDAITIYNSEAKLRFAKFKNNGKEINDMHVYDEAKINEYILKINQYINLFLQFAK